jgi:O-antigen/teichoic acid export membrane protein
MSGQILKNVSRGSLYLTAEQLAALVAGLAYSIMVVRWLGPGSYGILTIGLAFIGIATMGTGNFELYLERYSAEYEARGAMSVLQRAHLLTLGLKCALGILVCTAVIAFSGPIARYYQNTITQTTLLQHVVQLLGLLILFEGFTVTGRAVLFGLQRYGWIASISIVSQVIKIAIVAVLWWKGRGMLFLSAALVVVGGLQGVALTLAAVILVKRGRAAVAAQSSATSMALAEADADEIRPPLPPDPLPQTKSLLSGIVRYTMPLYGARAAYVTGQNLSRLVLGTFVSPALLGYYSFALTMIERFATFIYALPFSILPSLTQLEARGDTLRFGRLLDKGFRLVTTAACAIATGLVLGAEPLTRIIGGTAYLPAVPVLRVLAIVLWLRTAQEPLTMAFYALRRTGSVLAIGVGRLTLEIGAILALLPLWSIRGAAWAAVVGAGFGLAAGLVFLTRDVGRGARRVAVVAKTAVLVLLASLASRALAGLPGPGWVSSVFAFVVWVPLFLVAVFVADLVTEDDLSLAGGMDIRRPWLRGLRDRVVSAGLRFSRAVGSHRPGALATVEGS